MFFFFLALLNYVGLNVVSKCQVEIKKIRIWEMSISNVSIVWMPSIFHPKLFAKFDLNLQIDLTDPKLHYLVNETFIQIPFLALCMNSWARGLDAEGHEFWRLSLLHG